MIMLKARYESLKSKAKVENDKEVNSRPFGLRQMIKNLNESFMIGLKLLLF